MGGQKQVSYKLVLKEVQNNFWLKKYMKNEKSFHMHEEGKWVLSATSFHNHTVLDCTQQNRIYLDNRENKPHKLLNKHRSKEALFPVCIFYPPHQVTPSFQ